MNTLDLEKLCNHVQARAAEVDPDRVQRAVAFGWIDTSKRAGMGTASFCCRVCDVVFHEQPETAWNPDPLASIVHAHAETHRDLIDQIGDRVPVPSRFIAPLYAPEPVTATTQVPGQYIDGVWYVSPAALVIVLWVHTNTHPARECRAVLDRMYHDAQFTDAVAAAYDTGVGGISAFLRGQGYALYPNTEAMKEAEVHQ